MTFVSDECSRLEAEQVPILLEPSAKGNAEPQRWASLIGGVCKRADEALGHVGVLRAQGWIHFYPSKLWACVNAEPLRWYCSKVHVERFIRRCV